MDRPLLKNLLREQMQIKGLTIEKIKQQTGIAERFLAAFLEDQKEKLPPAPYVRGYLLKIGPLLELDGAKLWDDYKMELTVKKSGAEDRLPRNRYALKKINKKWLGLVFVIALIIFYLITNMSRFLGKPEIEITSPTAQTLVTTANVITLSGRVSRGDKLYIDGEETLLDSEGNFSKKYTLETGLNMIEFTVKKLLGREIKLTRQIIYQP